MRPSICVLNVGTELLIGRTVNTSLTWLGKRIFELGGELVAAAIIRDDEESFRSALSYLVSLSPNYIISTGGLGPTYDDITMQSIAKAIGDELRLNEEALRFMLERRKPGTEDQRKAYEKMATLPSSARPLLNYVGTAPGADIAYRGIRIFVMPGVPAEMQDMFERYVAPLFRDQYFKGYTLEIRGIYEADLSPLITELHSKYPGVYIKSHPSIVSGESLIRLELWTQDRSSGIDEELKEIVKRLEGINGVRVNVQG